MLESVMGRRGVVRVRGVTDRRSVIRSVTPHTLVLSPTMEGASYPTRKIVEMEK